MWTDLVDLILPRSCSGCRARARASICPLCTNELAAAVPGPVAPSPVPPGFPDCVALDRYDGVLRELLLSYKERGRHDLARPLGRLLGAVASTGLDHGPVALVPVPATARAVRARYGDHLVRLSRYAAGALRRAGWPVVVCRPLVALPRPDSARLDRAGRARTARQAFRVRAARCAGLRRASAAGARIVLLDDVVTTGATLAAVAGELAGAGFRVHRAAVLAATQLRGVSPGSSGTLPMGESFGRRLPNEG